MGETFKIRFDVAKITPLHEHTNEDGFFIVLVNRSWSPLGAQRVWDLVNEKVWDGSRFHKVFQKKSATFGIPAKPSVAMKWEHEEIKDEPIHEELYHNHAGMLTLINTGPPAGPGRTTQAVIMMK